MEDGIRRRKRLGARQARPFVEKAACLDHDDQHQEHDDYRIVTSFEQLVLLAKPNVIILKKWTQTCAR